MSSLENYGQKVTHFTKRIRKSATWWKFFNPQTANRNVEGMRVFNATICFVLLSYCYISRIEQINLSMQHLVCFDIFKQGSKQSLSNFSPSWIRTWILGTNIVQAEALCLFLYNSCLCDNWIRIGLTKIMVIDHEH